MRRHVDNQPFAISTVIVIEFGTFDTTFKDNIKLKEKFPFNIGFLNKLTKLTRLYKVQLLWQFQSKTDNEVEFELSQLSFVPFSLTFTFLGGNEIN